MVDVALMEACGEELAERLEECQPTKVLTVEATGLLPGMFVGKALELPVVFARKSRQIGVSDSYQTSFKSSTKASSQDIYVSTEYLNPGDRVLIIDDFLAGGTTADALIRVCRMAGATVVGGGFLIEKATDAGRAYLSGYEIPLESLAVVDISPEGSIRILEEEVDETELQQQQDELDRLLDSAGRINLDFTVGAGDADPPPEDDADADEPPTKVVRLE
jgi:xanthine phosphoribosyltransferase